MATTTQPRPADDEQKYDIDLVGLVLALVGAGAVLIGVFLPRLESSSFGGVAENSLIQQGDGLIFICGAIAIAGSAYRAWRGGTRPWAVLVLGGLVLAGAIYYGTSKDMLMLYPLDSAGNPDTSAAGEKARAGIGIYVVGVGGLLALAGGWRMRSDSEPVQALQQPAARPTPQFAPPAPESIEAAAVGAPAGGEPTKKCPDCAETILAAAHVCRYCGYRFPLEQSMECPDCLGTGGSASRSCPRCQGSGRLVAS